MQPDLWHDLSPGNDLPNVVTTIIEIPRRSRNKYEYSKKDGVIKLDRMLYSSIYYPGDYGFIPQTYFDDDDPLDILVMLSNETFPGCLVEARPIGMLKMIDKEERDYKILAVATGDPNYSDFHSLADVPQHYLVEVRHFFRTYKQLEGGVVEDLGWADVEDARAEILRSVQLYEKTFTKQPKK
ncbi:MAG: inorganic diphosphatase [Anaerolineales bacterium]